MADEYVGWVKPKQVYEIPEKYQGRKWVKPFLGGVSCTVVGIALMATPFALAINFETPEWLNLSLFFVGFLSFFYCIEFSNKVLYMKNGTPSSIAFFVRDEKPSSNRGRVPLDPETGYLPKRSFFSRPKSN